MFKKYDGPQYSVLKSYDAIEIRQYDEAMMAEVAVDGSRDEAVNEAFRILFKYITGSNKAGQEIAMTAPVAQQRSGSNSWRVAFFLPNSFTKNDAPAPTDPRITLKPLDNQKMLSIRFLADGAMKTIKSTTKSCKYSQKSRN